MQNSSHINAKQQSHQPVDLNPVVIDRAVKEEP
jgi:hypothetical protein